VAYLASRRRERWLAAIVAFVAFGDAAYSVWINPMGLADLQDGVPFAVACAVAAGVSIAWLGRATGRGALFVGGAAAVLLVAPVALASWGARWAAAAGDPPRGWVEQALATLPPRAVALVERDDTAAGLLFVTTAEAARPDVAVLVRQHLWDVVRNRAVLARAGVAGIDPAHVSAALATTQRTIGWELGVDPVPRGFAWRPGAVLGTLAPRADGAGVPADVRAALAHLERVFDVPGAADPNARRVHAVGLVGLGRVEYDRGALTRALALFEASVRVDPLHTAGWVNVGVVLDRQGRHARAGAVTERAIALDEGNVRARLNAARFFLSAGDDTRARRHAERALRLAPRDPAAWTLAGVLDARAQRFARARARLEHALRLDPEDEDARRNLARLPGTAARPR